MTSVLQTLLYPVAKFLERQNFFRRIMIIGVVFAVPMLLIGYGLDSQLRADLAFFQREMLGDECFGVMLELIQYFQKHRAQSTAYLLGNQSYRDAMLQTQAKIAELIKSMDELADRYNRELDFKQRWEEVKSFWQDLQARGESMSPEENFWRHCDLLEKAFFVVQDIADQSELSRGSSLGVHVLVRAAISSPMVLEYVTIIRTAATFAMADQKLDPVERARIAMAEKFVSAAVRQTEMDFEHVKEFAPEVYKVVEDKIRTTNERLNAIMTLVRERILGSARSSVTPQELTAAAIAVVEAAQELASALSEEGVGKIVTANQQRLRRTRTMVLSGVVLALLIAFGMFFAFLTTMTQRIQQVIQHSEHLSDQVFPELVSTLQRMAEGDLSQRVDIALPTVELNGTGDTEEGRLLRSSAQLVNSAQRIIDAYAAASSKLAQVIGEVTAAATRLTDISEQMSTATQQVSDAITQIANAIQQSTQDISNQSAVINHTQSAFDQLNQAVDSIANNAQEQARLVSNLAQATDRIQQVMQEFTQVVSEGIQEAGSAHQVAVASAQRLRQMLAGVDIIRNSVEGARQRVEGMNRLMADIGKIVSTIADIAQQTNLLALNAAIEAARAGEQGRGFSVVADEVRKLAERSAQATKEIADLIATVQQSAEESVKAMEETYRQVVESAAAVSESETALMSITEAVQKVRAQSGQLERVQREMAGALEQVFGAVQRLSEIAEQNAAGTEELSATVADMSQQMRRVVETSEQVLAAMEEVSAASEEVNAQAQQLSEIAANVAADGQKLAVLVSQFRVDGSGSRRLPKLQWDKSVEVGEAKIDAQHQELYRMINRLGEVIMQRDEMELDSVLVALERYVNEHFSYEESCFERWGCPMAARNKEAHERFKSTFASLKERLRDEGQRWQAALELHRTLANWLPNHILGVDRKCGQQRHGVAAAAARAPRTGNGL